MYLDNVASYGQSQSRAASAACVVDLVEALEYVWKVRWLNAWPVVLDIEPDHAIFLAGTQSYSTTLRHGIKGIGDEIREHLLKFQRVRLHRRELGFHIYRDVGVGVLSERDEPTFDVLKKLFGIHRLHVERGLP